MSDIIVRFLGTRGSYPVSGKEYSKYGGKTTCVAIEILENILIFDAGTGIIDYGKELIKNKQKNIHLFFSHTHIDHIQGLPYFMPLFYKNSKINIYGPKLNNKEIKDVCCEFMSNTFFPVELIQTSSNKNFYTNNDEKNYIINVETSDLEIKNRNDIDRNDIENKIIIKCKKVENHPVGGVSIYRIEYKCKSVVFATDVEGKYDGDSSLIAFAKESNILIQDATYLDEDYKNKVGWGHSTGKMAGINAKYASVKKLVLTHHDPEHSDIVVESKLESTKEYFENSTLAYDNCIIKI